MDILIKRMVPNLLTLLNGAFGLIAIYYIMAGNPLFASLLILSAAGFDGMDGLTARKLHISNKNGVVYDSVSDAISFVIAPSLMLLLFLAGSRIDNTLIFYISFIVAALLFSAGIARLTKYTIKDSSYGYFEGIPTPFAATFIVLLIYINNFIAIRSAYIILVMPVAAAIAILMISPVKYLKPAHSKKSLVLSLSIGIFTLLAVTLRLLDIFPSFSNHIFVYVDFALASIALALALTYLVFLPLTYSKTG